MNEYDPTGSAATFSKSEFVHASIGVPEVNRIFKSGCLSRSSIAACVPDARPGKITFAIRRGIGCPECFF
jgi:hypothetical protein